VVLHRIQVDGLFQPVDEIFAFVRLLEAKAVSGAAGEFPAA
jgi:hypothetical protein